MCDTFRKQSYSNSAPKVWEVGLNRDRGKGVKQEGNGPLDSRAKVMISDKKFGFIYLSGFLKPSMLKSGFLKPRIIS